MYRLCSASLSRSLENRYSAVAAQLASRAHMQVVLAAEGNNTTVFFFGRSIFFWFPQYFFLVE